MKKTAKTKIISAIMLFLVSFTAANAYHSPSCPPGSKPPNTKTANTTVKSAPVNKSTKKTANLRQAAPKTLPPPTYPCNLAGIEFPQIPIAGTSQEVKFTIGYDSKTATALTISLRDPVTRKTITESKTDVTGKGEKKITLPFTAPDRIGDQQMIYEVNYFSTSQKRELTCKDGADFIKFTTVEAPKILLTQSQQETQQVAILTTMSPPSTSFPIIPFAVTGTALIGAGLFMGRKKIFKRDQDGTKPVPVPAKPGKPRKRYVCSCNVKITIPDEIPVCICWDSPFKLNSTSAENSSAFLDVEDLQKKNTYKFNAEFTLHCEGPVNNLRYKWTINNLPKKNEKLPDYLEVECEASYDTVFPDGTKATVKCGAVKKIKLAKSTCEVYIVHVEGAGYDIGYGHIGMQIICGPSNVIYGYYLGSGTIKGKGQVVANNDPGKRYENFYEKYKKTFYNIKRLNKGKKLSCHQCQSLVLFWKHLEEDPGTYGIHDHTCATLIADALEHIGLGRTEDIEPDRLITPIAGKRSATTHPSDLIAALFHGYPPDFEVNQTEDSGVDKFVDKYGGGFNDMIHNAEQKVKGWADDIKKFFGGK